MIEYKGYFSFYYGIIIYYHRFYVINYKAGRTVCEPSYPKVDKDGYTEFQLWDFMSIYGSYMKMGEPNVICPLEIVFEEERCELNEFRI